MQQQQDLLEFPVISWSSDDERENSDIQDIMYPKDTSCSSISSSEEREENWDLSAKSRHQERCVSKKAPGGRKMRWCVSNGPIRGPSHSRIFPCLRHPYRRRVALP
jgi:hypothetical protein